MLVEVHTHVHVYIYILKAALQGEKKLAENKAVFCSHSNPNFLKSNVKARRAHQEIHQVVIATKYGLIETSLH